MQPRYLLAMFALAACGDDAGSSPIDSGLQLDASADARPDASPDANLATPLFGNWVKSPDAFTDQTYQAFAFRADGTATVVRADATENGEYRVPAPGRIRFLDGTDFLESNFVIENDQLLLDALLPQGQVIGLVGTWSGTFDFQGGSVMSSMTIAADNTGTFTSISPSGTRSSTGTWVAEGTGLAITWAAPINHTDHVRPLGGLGLGTQLLVKQP